MAVIKSRYKVKNANGLYDTIHLETTAEQVVETESKKFINNDEKNTLSKILIDGDNIDLGGNLIYHSRNKPIASDILFEDGSSFQEKLESGELDGKDGLTTSIKVNGQVFNHIDGNIEIPSYPVKYCETIGDGESTAIDVIHNFNTMDVSITVREIITNQIVYVDCTVKNDRVSFNFEIAPKENEYRVVIIG